MMRRFKQLFLYILLVTALLSVFYLCLFIGSVRIASTDVRAILRCLFAGGTPPDKNLYNLLVYVRMPRLVLNMLAGAVLSMAGILMQTLTHNPLAEPYVLGVSSGKAHAVGHDEAGSGACSDHIAARAHAKSIDTSAR